MTRTYKDMVPKTLFGKWLLDRMNEEDINCVQIAEKVYATRQCIRNHINGDVKPSYVWVMAYCQMFGGNPEEIYKLRDKEV